MLPCASASPRRDRSTHCRPMKRRPRSSSFSASIMSSLSITRSAEPPEDWHAFAEARGTFYHHPDWARCLGEIYRLRLDYYSARSDGELRGLLAVAEIPRLLGPRRFVSLPFSYAAGPLAEDAATAAALSRAVLERAQELG